jgi:hypothetical protein
MQHLKLYIVKALLYYIVKALLYAVVAVKSLIQAKYYS